MSLPEQIIIQTQHITVEQEMVLFLLKTYFIGFVLSAFYFIGWSMKDDDNPGYIPFAAIIWFITIPYMIGQSVNQIKKLKEKENDGK